MTTDGPRLIRAAYTTETITVYQAYAPNIAEPAMRAGTFTAGFSRDRMTWIEEWIVSISDVTALARQVEDLTRSGLADRAAQQVGTERVYPLASALARRIGADPDGPPVPTAAPESLP